MVMRWEIKDLDTDDTIVVEVNPAEGGSPARRRNIKSKTTTAPDGDPIVYEGQAEPSEYKVSGSILTQSHFEQLWALVAPGSGPHEVTDDLGRVLTVVFSEFAPERVRSALNPWKHKYTMTGTVLSLVMP